MGLGLLALGSIIAGIASAGANIYAANQNKKSVEDTNAANIQMQNAANQTQIDLSNTAHQREMADLKAAGLNPVLTAMGGQGAPVAQISSPKAQAPQIDLSGIGSALTGTVQALTNLKLADMLDTRQNRIANMNNQTRRDIHEPYGYLASQKAVESHRREQAYKEMAQYYYNKKWRRGGYR